MRQTNITGEHSASQLITAQIADLTDWRGSLYSRLRTIVHDAAPDLTEEWKWGTGVWARKGNVVSVGVFKDHLKLNFFKGAALDDPHGLFNAGLEAKATRAVDLFAGDKLDEPALSELIRAAVSLNGRAEKRNKPISPADTTRMK